MLARGPRSPGSSGFPSVTVPASSVSLSSHDPISGAGLVAVFDYHRKKGYADLYSLHSWCGILVFVLYVVQVGEPLQPHGHGPQRGRSPGVLQCPGAASDSEVGTKPGLCRRGASGLGALQLNTEVG